MTIKSIRAIVEDNVFSYLSSNIPGVPIHRGITDEIRVLPIIVGYASGSSSMPELGSHTLGNYVVKLNIHVFSSADDETQDVHRERVAAVIGLLSNKSAIIAAWQDGILYDCWIENDEEGMSQRRYGNLIEFTVKACMPTA